MNGVCVGVSKMGGGGGQTSQLSLFWCETQAFGPNLTLSLQTPQISLFSVSSLQFLLVQG